MTQHSVSTGNGVVTYATTDAKMLWKGEVIEIEMHKFCGPMFMKDGEEFVPPAEDSRPDFKLFWDWVMDCLEIGYAELMPKTSYVNICNSLRLLNQIGLKIYGQGMDANGNEEQGSMDYDFEAIKTKIESLVIKGIESEVAVMQYKYATHRLIDSVWTVVYQELENGKVQIIRYDRDNMVGYKLENKLPKAKMIESGANRTLLSIRVDDKELEVENKGYIFNYR